MHIGIDHGMVPGAVVGHATTQEWGRWRGQPRLLVPNSGQFPFYHDYLVRNN